MLKVERALEIDATPEQVWSVMGRFMHINEFAPEVVRVEALTAAENQVGAQRRCHFNNGQSLVETVTEWQVGRGYSVSLSEMDSMPMAAANATLLIDPMGNRARVVWRFEGRMKFGPLGWLLGQGVFKPMMGRVIAANLEGLAKTVKNLPKSVDEVA
ncbi:polyketide cyclase/dehydrase/lipid transport protein [Shimia isoporae]|uniref:Polyketide cyclase/dehydrase/lipid transport protein n=1 Tax=Shimia isoporae TaxID=647720 RepID=A0A4R1NUT0_9RHOB|nr:SRPBCC family protein [Shimia isoporae]TCL09008.1 polyketide cyclase/dehydrase/lipid transport protein [Shimia isoporae]